MSISILDSNGGFLANDGTNGISILAPDGSLRANLGNNAISIFGPNGTLRPHGSGAPLSILSPDGSLKPFETNNTGSILNPDGSLFISNSEEFAPGFDVGFIGGNSTDETLSNDSSPTRTTKWFNVTPGRTYIAVSDMYVNRRRFQSKTSGGVITYETALSDTTNSSWWSNVFVAPVYAVQLRIYYTNAHEANITIIPL